MSQGDTYGLERTSVETDRLNRQNELLIEAVGYTLHPLIKDKLPPSPRIAEVGTGTGAFLASLSKDVPADAILDGYDISDVAFLPPSQRPPNLTLTVSDAKQPPPPDLHGTYDVICLRFMNAALPAPSDWTSVVAHAFQLLKPRTGALQWIEGDFTGLTVPLQTTPMTKTSALQRGGAQSIGSMPHLKWFVANLRPIVAEAAGCEVGDVVQNVVSTDRVGGMETRRGMSGIAIGAMQSIMKFQSAAKLPGALSEEEVAKLVEEMKEEIEGGAYCRADLHQFVAFKGGSN